MKYLKNYKTVDLNTTISIILLTVNKLKSPIKMQELSDGIRHQENKK